MNYFICAIIPCVIISCAIISCAIFTCANFTGNIMQNVNFACNNLMLSATKGSVTQSCMKN